MTPAPPKPKVIAHRGLRSEYPENTLLSISKALELDGLYGIEFDVDLCDQPVVLHQETLLPDPSFARLMPASRNFTSRNWVAEHSAHEILQLDAGSWMDPKFSAERIPTLRQVLELDWKDKTAFVELKDPSFWSTRELDRPKRMLDAVLPDLLRFPGKLGVLSFNPEMLKELQRRAPQISSTLLLWLEWQGRAAEVVALAQSCGASSLAMADSMLLANPRETASWLEAAQQAKLMLCVYPISPAHDEPEYASWSAASQHARWAKLCDVGVDAIVSDFARENIEFLAKVNADESRDRH
jgi:glycerophosphoryl diester phosphodiesterase